MKVYIVVDYSNPYLSGANFFIDLENANKFIDNNQENLAFKTKKLDLKTIDVLCEQAPNILYVVRSLTDNAHFDVLGMCSIKDSKKIEGFYATQEEAYNAGEKLPKLYGKNFYQIDLVQVEELKPSKNINKKLKK